MLVALAVVGLESVAAGNAACFAAVTVMSDGSTGNVSGEAAWAVAPGDWCAVEQGRVTAADALSAEQTAVITPARPRCGGVFASQPVRLCPGAGKN